MTPLEWIRLALAAAAAFFGPGLAWSFVFFPTKRPVEAGGETAGIDWIERTIVAFGLSITMVPAIILGANILLQLPVRPWAIMLVIILLTAVPVGYLFWRKRNFGVASAKQRE